MIATLRRLSKADRFTLAPVLLQDPDFIWMVREKNEPIENRRRYAAFRKRAQQHHDLEVKP